MPLGLISIRCFQYHECIDGAYGASCSNMANPLATSNSNKQGMTAITKEERMDTAAPPPILQSSSCDNSARVKQEEGGGAETENPDVSLPFSSPPSGSGPGQDSRGRSSTWPSHPHPLMDTGEAALGFALTPSVSQQLEQQQQCAVSDGRAVPTTGVAPSPMSPSTPATTAGQQQAAAGGKEKKAPRRNAWGPDSYSDLISKAILSTKDKRMTLNQIYEWMVANVPYFRDKGDTNSAAGWKVSTLCAMYMKQAIVKNALISYNHD